MMMPCILLKPESPSILDSSTKLLKDLLKLPCNLLRWRPTVWLSLSWSH